MAGFWGRCAGAIVAAAALTTVLSGTPAAGQNFRPPVAGGRSENAYRGHSIACSRSGWAVRGHRGRRSHSQDLGGRRRQIAADDLDSGRA